MSRKNVSPPTGNTCVALQTARWPPGRSSSQARRYFTAGSHPAPVCRGEQEKKGFAGGGPPGLEVSLEYVHVREFREVAATRHGKLSPDLNAGDPVSTPGQRGGRLAGGASDLQEPITGSEIRQARQVVVQAVRVIGP